MKKYYIGLAISVLCAVLGGVLGVSTSDKDLEGLCTAVLFLSFLPMFFCLYKIGSGMDGSSSKKRPKKKKKHSDSHDDYDDDDDDDNNDSGSDSGGDGGGDGD